MIFDRRSLVTLLLASGVALPAQESQPPLVFRSTTRLVQVSVIATRDGKPAEGLKQEDFVLTDGGKPQNISLFSVESGRGRAPSELRRLAPNRFSNRTEFGAGTASSITIILLDSLNTKFTDRAFARDEIVKYLKSIQPDDRVGLYALGNGIRILHEFTATARELLERLEGYKGEPLSIQLDAWLSGRGMSRPERVFYTENRVRGTLRALQFIADHLTRIPGRKNLVWISSAFPLWLGLNSSRGGQKVLTGDVAQCVRAINNANLAIYPVDARGLTLHPDFEDASVSGFGKVLYAWYPQALPALARKEDAMQELAEGTGGRAYFNTNDLAKAIRDSVADAALSYTLGYYPNDNTSDGKYHTIAVKVRQPGIVLRHRKGYFSLPEQPQDEKTRKAELRQVVFSPLDATEIGLLAELKPVAGRPGRLEFLVHIDPQGVSLQPQGDRWVATVDILFMQKDASGRPFNGRDDTLDLRLSQASYQQVMRSGFTYRQIIEPGSGATEVRVVARDAGSGSVGSVTVPLTQVRTSPR